jgi:hypothetical protein
MWGTNGRKLKMLPVQKDAIIGDHFCNLPLAVILRCPEKLAKLRGR